MTARRSLELDLGDLLASIGASTDDDETTTRILDAAAALFASHGIRRCSIEDIASHSGIGRTTVYRRFGGRTQVIEAVLARECHRFLTSIMRADIESPVFADVVVNAFVVGLRAAETSVLSELVRTEPELRDMLTVDSAPIISAATTFLVMAFGPVEDPPTGARVEAVAELLVRLAISLVLDGRTSLDLCDADRARRSLHDLLDPLLEPLGELRSDGAITTIG